MAKYFVEGTSLTAVADAIRTKGGTTEQLSFPDGFVSAVEGIQAGGGGDDALLYSVLDRSVTEFSDSKVTAIGGYALCGCSNLTKVKCPNLATIGDYAFNNCTNLTTVNSDVLTSIGQFGFAGCTKLNSVDTNELASIGANAFSKCNALTSVSCPKVTSFGHSAFINCTSLVSAYLPLVEVLNMEQQFKGCTALKDVDFSSACMVGPNMFYGCTSLEEASFPSLGFATKDYGYGTNRLVGLINGGAFRGCTNLKKVDLAKLNGISADAFNGCSSLEAIIIRRSDAVAPLSNVSAFTNSGGTVYVPSALITQYQQATNWSTLYAAGTCNFVAIEGSEYE